MYLKNKDSINSREVIKVIAIPNSLSSEQVLALFNNRTDLIVSQETTAGEEYICSITPNDGFEDGQTLNSSSLQVVWSITFNVTGSQQYSNLHKNFEKFFWR